MPKKIETKDELKIIEDVENDIIRLKSMALNEGMPYQTYISHMIHKLTTGALKIH